MAEQRYQAVLAVISDGLSISQVASKVGVSRQTLHSWLARYEAEGLEGLADRSHRPVSCPHQMPAESRRRVGVAAFPAVLGAAAAGVRVGQTRGVPVPSESAVYRALVRAEMIDPHLRDRRRASGNAGNAGRRWSCGRWTSWAGSRWPMAPARRR